MAKAAPKKAAKPLSKSQVVANIAEASGVSKKEVSAVLAALLEEVRKNMGIKGVGVFVIPGLVKIDKKKRPAQPAKKGVRNPFTGQIQDVPAKPATVKVRVRPLKALKDMVPKA